MDTVRRLLHAAREALDLSQSNVTRATGVSTRTIHRMENCVGMVGFDILEKLRSHFATMGATLAVPEDGEKWAIAFSLALAPAPGSGAERRIYDPVPGRVLKAARVILGMTQAELGTHANLAHTTVRRLEGDDPTARPEKAYALQRFLEEKGIEFAKPSGGHGWTLRC
jgi:DNA-binding XRE family transcriptional regulator